MLRNGFWGFLFGTIGLTALASSAALIPFADILAAILMFPGRLIALALGSDDTGVEVVLVAFINGVIYSLIFMGLGAVFGLKRPT